MGLVIKIMSAIVAKLISQFNRLPPREQKIVIFKLGAWFEFAQERVFHYVYPRTKKFVAKLADLRRRPTKGKRTVAKHRFFHRYSDNFVDLSGWRRRHYR